MLANSLGTYNLLMIAQKNKAKFLYASSSEVYGEPEKHPQPENYFGNVNPNGPRSCYDEAKRFGEAMTFSFIRKYNTDARIVRIFNTYGPRMDPNDGRVVSNFITAALSKNPLSVYGTGTQTRCFCYVSDLITGLVSAMELKKTQGEVFNLGSEEEHTILELTVLIKKILNRNIEIRHEPLPIDDPTRRRPDLSKAKKILGYQPKVTLEEGLTKTIDYFQNN